MFTQGALCSMVPTIPFSLLHPVGLVEHSLYLAFSGQGDELQASLAPMHQTAPCLKNTAIQMDCSHPTKAPHHDTMSATGAGARRRSWRRRERLPLTEHTRTLSSFPHLEDGVQVVGRNLQPIIVQDEGGVGAGEL
jgi:hypothetical protein